MCADRTTRWLAEAVLVAELAVAALLRLLLRAASDRAQDSGAPHACRQPLQLRLRTQPPPMQIRIPSARWSLPATTEFLCALPEADSKSAVRPSRRIHLPTQFLHRPRCGAHH